MNLAAALSTAQMVVFPLLGVAAALVWLRHRSRPAAYLAAAFGSLGVVLLISRLGGDATTAALQTLTITALLVFPWLLAAFAWSFSGALPRWLLGLGAAILALDAWQLLGSPLTDDDGRNGSRAAFIVVFLAIWAVLTVATAWRLWRSGGTQRLVRARMRLMASGSITLTATLFLSAAAALGGPDGDEIAALLSLLAAGLFVTGFAPPAPLRLWWRRRSSREWQTMQSNLIAAATPEEVARAVAPMAADLLGGRVTIVGTDGSVLADSGGDRSSAVELAHRTAAGESLGDHQQAVAVDRAWMVIGSTPYSPVFGQQEHQMIDAFSLQLRMALERAELFEAHRQALISIGQSRQELEALLMGLSHDLRSPAVAIAGYSQLLRDVDEAEDRDEMLDALEQSAGYLNALIDEMLELSRVGRVELDTEPIDLPDLLRRIAERLRVSHPGVMVDIDPALPVVRMNRLRAEQLFDNLLTNAAKHGGRDDIRVTVSSQGTNGDGSRLTVADDGRGIDAEDHASLFAIFQRGRTSTDGSGVGLSMVRRIVESYGGSIEHADSAVGARFDIHLPPAVIEPVPAVAHAASDDTPDT